MTAKIQIAVIKAFLLTLADGTVKKFEEGLHEVEESIASHWYVKAHSNVVVEPVAEPATPAASATEPPPPPADTPTPPPPPTDAEPAQPAPTPTQEATEAANVAVDKQLEAETPKKKK